MVFVKNAGLGYLFIMVLVSLCHGYCYRVLDVSCGECHSLLLMENGSLWSCGSNGDWGLGTDIVDVEMNTLVQVRESDGPGYISGIVGIDAGWKHSLACDENGSLWGWGKDDHGQLGNGVGASDSQLPQRVSSTDGNGYLENVVYVSAGRSGTHSLAVSADGYVYGWGNNASGQCGIGSSGYNLELPVQVLCSNGYLSNIKEVCAGVIHSLALDNDGNVWEFGGNDSSNIAVMVTGLPEIVHVATCAHSLALDVNGNVWMWVGSFRVKVPCGAMNTQSGYLENIKAISAGDDYSVAVDNNGFVWKWGNGELPALMPDGEMGTSSGYLENIDKIDAGYFNFQLAVDNDGVAWGIGYNVSGELGVEHYDDLTEPAMVGCAEGYLHVILEQTYDGDCLGVDDDLELSVCVVNDSDIDYEDLYMVLHLDYGCSYPDGDWAIDENMEPYQPDSRYDDVTHTIRYYIGDDGSGTLEAGMVSCEVFDLTVNDSSVPGMAMVNIAELCTGDIADADPNVVYFDPETVGVCCREGGGIIYVSEYAVGLDNGMTWENAYSGHDGLRKALARIESSNCGGMYNIYVAAGTYYPGTNEQDNFVLFDGMEIYGGFPVKGCDFASRNPKKYLTVLTAQVDSDPTPDIDTVVTMGNDCLLDGFTVELAKEHNVLGEGVNFTVKNCQINNSWQYGIYALAGDITVKSCKIYGNDYDGIYHEGSGFNLNVYNSWIMRSGKTGVTTNESTLTAKNNIISESDMEENGSQGIFMLNPTNSPILYNNTISNNKSEGLIYVANSSPEDPNSIPTISNCIIYYNNSGNNQLSGVDPNQAATYSCIQNCEAANNNFSNEPMFAYKVDIAGAPDPNNYHLAYNSICIDSGNPALESLVGDYDYDNENRLIGQTLDVGADEVYSCTGDYTEEEFFNPLDINVDGIVNMKEFAILSAAWLAHDPNDPVWLADPDMLNPEFVHPVLGPASYGLVWNDNCNFDTNGESQYNIDMAELELLASEWLWQSCWYQSSQAAVNENLAILTALPESTSYNTSNIDTLACAASIAVVEDISPYSGLANAELAELVSGIYELQSSIHAEKNTATGKDRKALQEIEGFFDNILVEIEGYLTEADK